MEAADPDRYRGMVPREQWAASDVHQHSKYACGKCGKRLPDPHAVYDHIAAEHPPALRPKKTRRTA